MNYSRNVASAPNRRLISALIRRSGFARQRSSTSPAETQPFSRVRQRWSEGSGGVSRADEGRRRLEIAANKISRRTLLDDDPPQTLIAHFLGGSDDNALAGD